MGQFPAVDRILRTIKNLLHVVGEVVILASRKIGIGLSKFWVLLKLRLPFLEALVQRHLRNPATIFIDSALFVLSLYLIIGVTGYVLIYPKKSEAKPTEHLSVMYPFPAAQVDQSFIWSHKFLQRLRFLNTFNSQAPSDLQSRPPTDKELREQVIAGLIEDKIVYLEAKKLDLRVTEDELNKAYEAQKSQTEKFEEKIKQLYGMRPQEFKEVLAERILKEKVKASVGVRIKLRHILTSTESSAHEARRQIEGGKPFADAAKEYSQDTQTKDKGGDLGYWTKGELTALVSPGFEEEAFKIEPNTRSNPIATKFGYHIIEVTEKTGTVYQSYDEWYANAKQAHSVKIYIPL